MHRDRLPCCFQITALWSPHSKGIWNSRLLIVSRSCQVPLISLPFTWHPAGVYLCSHILVWNSKVREHGAAMRRLGSPAHSQLLQDFVHFVHPQVCANPSVLFSRWIWLPGRIPGWQHSSLPARRPGNSAVQDPSSLFTPVFHLIWSMVMWVLIFLLPTHGQH